VSARKIIRTTNHKFIALWGRAYSSSHTPHVYALGGFWANTEGGTNEGIAGDSWFEMSIYEHGYPSTRRIGKGPGVTSSGPGLKRGQWNRVRYQFDSGTGPNSYDGIIRVWFNDDLILDRSDLPLWPVPVEGETNDPHPWWDAGYLHGWLNGGFMQDTDYFVDDFSLYVADPGWR
jgi:hypothetical protein